MRAPRLILPVILSLALSSVAFGAEPTETTTPETAVKSKVTVGTQASEFRALANRSAQMGLGFCALLFVGASLLKRYAKTKEAAPDTINILSRKQLSPRSSILLAEVEGQHILLSQSGDDVNFLTNIEQYEEEDFETYIEEEEAQSRKTAGA